MYLVKSKIFLIFLLKSCVYRRSCDILNMLEITKRKKTNETTIKQQL